MVLRGIFLKNLLKNFLKNFTELMKCKPGWFFLEPFGRTLLMQFIFLLLLVIDFLNIKA